MYTFFLIVESPVALDWPAQLLKRLGHVYRDDGYFLVTAPAGFHDGWIAISQVEPNMEDQTDKQPDYPTIKMPIRFMVEGRDTKTKFANQFLFALADSTKALIETDQGYIASVSSFKALLKAGVAWLTLFKDEELDTNLAENPTNAGSNWGHIAAIVDRFILREKPE